MNYTYFVNSDQVTLINLKNGNKVTIYRDDNRFDEFKSLIQQERYDQAEAMDIKSVVTNFMSDNVSIVDGIGTIKIGGVDYPLANAIVSRITQMVADGFDSAPLIKFLNNLYNNPSKTSIDELFLFLEACQLPITTDGCFIAYKIVKSNYMDVYTGKMDNSIGKTVEMPRFAVDDQRSRTCSAGLHFCSKEYLPHYGSSVQSTDRCVLVKINPADVVSIPADYNNAKGRTCKYVVVGEVEDADFRKMLADREYTESSVVDEEGNEFDYNEYDDDDGWDMVDEWGGYYFNIDANSWFNEDGECVTRSDVMQATGKELSEIIDEEVAGEK